MNKKELDQKVIEIDAVLKALGDLNVLVQQSKNLPNIINDAQAGKTNIEKFLNELPAHSEEIKKLTSEVTILKDQVSAKNSEVSELVTQTKDTQNKVGELIAETKVQLGVAANAKLASTFEQVKNGLINDKNRWFKWWVGAVIVFIVATGLVVLWQLKDFGTLYHYNFLIKLALTSPFAYFVVFINREYSRTRNLIEEYTFKAAIARSFEAYKEIVQSTDQENCVSTHKFIIDSIGSLYSSPMVNVKRNSHKERESTPDILSSIRSIMEDFFPSKND
ncbi:MAG: hypothetical protein A2528_00660 [Candidatus Staskawiczbacteria bacterium RIFOXYD2_FULL_37_9]|uniref:Uncharacterized protein n=1 Tax=Candidatus Staskawiczbacteria bacterium RIFOXYB1_FULL_37_44 TaxID=1802223 RepID=A0A1G2IW86_9BACT|nr:MAG: hypothetical protein A2358_03810 [Candidatus Staskawiczbacteria bacterium RIFOXYB1_FULL_37_44]OGZ84144.1 MAG: hypothetical protein A2416_03620 [Candidatus Staskawiczbacteria bacterium RIFOXYC1_FULL_37_52]OGZ89267.1 MAG: hypothetical protein A2444_02360 [Candidatus Staskawiczbacteria bacterium RIFOXYC2_FULL_37_19]OGZ93323.1 MAG: hypothetical protein A2528_00660 [Candidatus Staskawiczbacteria bacterium RIFOXYD2_FULL_37_9]